MRWGTIMTIGEISKITGISESALRYYERKSLIQIARDVNNRRAYVQADISWIQFIQKLKDTGMLLRDIQRYSALRYLGDSTMEERLKILEDHQKYVKEQSDKWQQYTRNLEDKMNYYRMEIKKQSKSNQVN